MSDTISDPDRAALVKVSQLLGDTDPMSQELGSIFALTLSALTQLEWSEDEIDRFCARHPAHADDLYHSHELLVPTADVMTTEFVYRSHCRELLARVVAGEDTRPPTNAEVAAACCETSLVGPLKPGGFTVYMRAWAAAFPDRVDFLGDVVDLDSYEHVAGVEADALERGLRRKLTVPDRTLRDVSCSGRHHGEPASACRYFKPEQLGLGL